MHHRVCIAKWSALRIRDFYSLASSTTGVWNGSGRNMRRLALSLSTCLIWNAEMWRRPTRIRGHRCAPSFQTHSSRERPRSCHCVPVSSETQSPTFYSTRESDAAIARVFLIVRGRCFPSATPVDSHLVGRSFARHRKGQTMPKYLIQGSYTPEGLKGLVKDRRLRCKPQ
jgi:hypothetical protein